jgi:hypothetical protein
MEEIKPIQKIQNNIEYMKSRSKYGQVNRIIKLFSIFSHQSSNESG